MVWQVGAPVNAFPTVHSEVSWMNAQLHSTRRWNLSLHLTPKFKLANMQKYTGLINFYTVTTTFLSLYTTGGSFADYEMINTKCIWYLQKYVTPSRWQNATEKQDIPHTKSTLFTFGYYTKVFPSHAHISNARIITHSEHLRPCRWTGFKIHTRLPALWWSDQELSYKLQVVNRRKSG